MQLSIIIPTLNRSASLKKTLQSIVDQHPSDWLFEVIVVDNGSTDDTREVCLQYEQQLKNVVYHYDDEPGQLTGRHKGTEISQANIISFIDDDVELNPCWITSIIQLFSDDEDLSLIGGPSLPKYHRYPPSWVQFFWQPSPYGGSMCLPLSLIDIGVERLEFDPLYIFGLNYSIRKKALLDLGGFHPDCITKLLQRYQGDGETGLSLKAKARNLKAIYSAKALVYHQVPAERLTPEYFENWFYYNGVCQSFTDLKNGSHPGTIGKKPAAAFSGIVSKAGSLLKKALKNNETSLPDEILKLQERFNGRYKEGYSFHQSAFNTDNSVRNWVLKEDYWDYKLPI